MANEESKTTQEKSVALAVGGALFLVAAGFFLWRDLALPTELVALAVTVLAAVTTLLGARRGWPPAVGPVALLATSAGSGLWFLATKEPRLLPALGVALVGSLIALARDDRRRRRQARGEADLAHWVSWHAFGTALLATTSALYFVFLTTGVAADSVARRLIPTVLWLAVGLGLLVGADRRHRGAEHVGLALIGVAVLKAAVYDSTHLSGGLRVAVLAAVGGLLVFAGTVVRRPRRPTLPEVAGPEDGNVVAGKVA
ncbi:MAG TPA: hypothetical protein VHU40_02235 [Polyangia bacterium]|nr:hypothetical protein [Polyangia bacterium]